MTERERIDEIDATIRQLETERRALEIKLWKIDPAVVRSKILALRERHAGEAAFKQLTHTEFVDGWQAGWMPAILVTDEFKLDDDAEFRECGLCSSGDYCHGHIYY